MTAQPLPPGRIRAAFAPITRPAYCTCDPAVDPHRHVVHVATYDATVTDRTDATDAEFEAVRERIEAAPAADPLHDQITDALFRADTTLRGGLAGASYEAVADVLVDVLKPAPGTDSSGLAVQRVLELADEMEADSVLAKQLADDARARGDRELQRINMRHARVAHHSASSIRAAVASQPPDGTPVP